jgi:pimeloyl-ACP methyl ester carboxylesterase
VTPRLVLVEGTWGGAWARPGTPFREFLHNHGVDVLARTQFWSGDVSGVPSLWASQKHSDWKAGAIALALYLDRLPYECRNVIAHSHGGNVALYAAAREGIALRRLITVCTPERGDMQDVAKQARDRITYWAAVGSLDGTVDWWRRLGQLFDGEMGWQYLQPHADINHRLHDIGHSKLLTDARKFSLWAPYLELVRLSDDQVTRRGAIR